MDLGAIKVLMYWPCSQYVLQLLVLSEAIQELQLLIMSALISGVTSTNIHLLCSTPTKCEKGSLKQ